jgi:geranylgeranyl diphosphate synthase type I
VERAGGRAWAAEEARRRLELGVAALDAAGLDGRARDELVDLGRFVVVRES